MERHADVTCWRLLQSFEHVLANINKLNRNLEAVIAVGYNFLLITRLFHGFRLYIGCRRGENPTAAPLWVTLCMATLDGTG